MKQRECKTFPSLNNKNNNHNMEIKSDVSDDGIYGQDGVCGGWIELVWQMDGTMENTKEKKIPMKFVRKL